MKKMILGIVALVLSTFALHAQQNCFNLLIDSQTALPGDTVCLSVRVDNFEDILAVQTAFEWDTTRLDFIEITNFNLPGLITEDFNLEGEFIGEGRATFAWFNTDFTGLDLTDGTAIFDFCFEVIGDDGYGGFQFVSTSDITNTEIVLGNSEILPSFSLLGGGVSIEDGFSEPVRFASACQDLGDCNTGSNLSVVVAGGTPPYTYSWMQGNATVGSGADFTNAPAGLYELIVSDMNGDEVSGLFNVTPEDGISVSNVVLTPPTCSNSDGAIQVLVAGGSGAYDFIWSTGQTDAYSISNLPAGSYSLTVTDANTGCDFAIGIALEDEELITSYAYECTIMPDGSTIVDISCAVWSDGQTPYTFEWSTGFTETTDEIISTLAGVSPDQSYSVTITDANGCTSIPGPATPDCPGTGGDPTIYVANETVAEGGSICIPVKASEVPPITRLDFALTWSTDVLSFTGVNEGALTALLDDGLDLSQTDNGELTVQWDIDIPEGLPIQEDATLFEICFDAVGDPGSSTDIAFDDSILASYLESGAEVSAAFEDGSCSILWDFLTAYSYECNEFADGSVLASVSYVVWAGGVPPYTFEWSTGLVEQDSIFSTLENVPDNTTYSLTITDTEGRTHSPDPVTPNCGGAGSSATVTIGEAVVNTNTNFCVPVTVSGAAEVTGFEAGMAWLPGILSYTGVTGGVLGDAATFTIDDSDSDIGQLSLIWNPTAPDAIFVEDGDVLFELCFDAIGDPGSSTGISFNASTHPFLLENVEGIEFTPVNGGAFIQGSGGPDDVTLQIGSAMVDTGEVVCLDVTVENFTEVGTVQLSINWDEDRLSFDTLILAGNLPGLNPATDFNLNLTDEGIIAMSWFNLDLNTVTLPDGAPLFTLCLRADTLQGPTPVTFSPTPVNIEVTDLENILPVVLQNGTVDVLQPEVWPGDTDVDGLVTHFDLLNIGLGFGTAGPERANATIAWEAQVAPGWQYATPNSNVNYKHLDTNGDGFIDAADTLALVNNWGEEVNFLPEEENRSMAGVIYIEPDTVVLGIPATFNIMLGEPGTTVPEVYGLAFTIVYDTSAVAPGSASASFLESWIGNTNEDLIGLSKDRYDDGRIDVALTRTNGLNAEGSGAIGQLHITIQDVIFMRGNDYPLDFDIENIRLINAAEMDFQLEGLPTSGVVKDGLVNVPETAQAFNVRAFPNPASDQISILVEGAQLESARLMATDGRNVQQIQGGQSEVNLQHLPEGLYLLQVLTSEGATTHRIMIAR
jgi:hypothetical protein